MHLLNKKEKTKIFTREQLRATLATTSKQLVWMFSLFGVAWITMSYILAFQGQSQIAESLSTEVCRVVIGSMGLYFVTKCVENAFKYNELGGQSNPAGLNEGGTTYVNGETSGSSDSYCDASANNGTAQEVGLEREAG